MFLKKWINNSDKVIELVDVDEEENLYFELITNIHPWIERYLKFKLAGIFIIRGS